MSSDLYIPMSIVLGHPGQFWFKTELNGSIEDAREALFCDEDSPVDWDYVKSEMTPLLMCKFGKRESWRPVEVFDHDLHISCGGRFRIWLLYWLENMGYEYHTPEYPGDRLKPCYNCGKDVRWLADDSRCKDCTRLTPDDVLGK